MSVSNEADGCAWAECSKIEVRQQQVHDHQGCEYVVCLTVSIS